MHTKKSSKSPACPWVQSNLESAERAIDCAIICYNNRNYYHQPCVLNMNSKAGIWIPGNL